MPPRAQPPAPTLDVTVAGVPVQVVVSPRRRTAALQVKPGTVTLRVPPGTDTARLAQFIETRRDWITAHLQRFQARADATPAYTFRSGETLPYLGETLTLHVTPTAARAWRDGHTLHAPTHDTRAHVEAWYRHEALRVMTPMTHAYAARISRHVRAVKLTDARTRWGSCTSGGVIRLNWRVLLGPPAVMTYLVAHEVAHLREMNHSARYWRVVAGLMPDYQAARAYLRAHGHTFTLEP
ncbi:M48 family metallopeptidase [Deinococcus maricopensis]|uniref:YgjP-like metallopeptidase domain-containing protein n=1 Tax=Deinococcus maricopensis (strain DSM 21211 / LMG 22137 / NRRL B-23946 / LB-34) TaxID=709986 RepID=E8U5D0_DEIML|nr:SprT family zinc-dependent metalloprotease [Deinococcus maricopensis]ADV66269.1 protein of unknown function DUF45 [Deinococcus maricopensis DSM 21211]